VIDKADIDIIGAYYQKAPAGTDLGPGRICDTIVTYLPLSRDVLKFDMDAANRGERITYTMGPPDKTTFNHIPVKNPPLERDEAFLVVRGKSRPVVVLSMLTSPVRGVGVIERDFIDVHLVVPLYSFQDTHTQAFRLRVEAFEYNRFFYMPTSDEFSLHEGFLRFDRSQVIPKGLLKPSGVTLTSNAVYVLHHWFEYFMTDELDRDLADYRGELLKRLPSA
jgi:hypothetical protein